MDSTSKYCTNCCQVYYLKGLSPEGYEHLPVFLACGHTMCHSCVYNILKFEEPLACKKCNQEMVFSPQDRALVLKNKNEFNKYFPINVFMLGEITMEHLKPNKEKKVMEKPYFIDLDAIIKSNEIIKGQCKECQSPSNKMCKQCATILCLSCFNKSHKNFIVFKNHVFQNMEVKFGLSNCKLHQNRPLEYYCKTCTKPICVDCLLLPDEKSCKNHDFVSIQQVNEGFLNDITEAIPKIDELYRRFTDTAVNIGKLLQDVQNESNNSDFTNLLSEVEEHYSKLISHIKTQKDVITSTIIKVKDAEIESLLKIKDHIENGIKKTKQFSNVVDNIDHSQIEKINLAAILEDAKEILKMSWYLKKEEGDDNFKLTVNEDVCDKVKDYVRLEGSGTSLYKLCTTQELETLGIEIPPAPSAPVHPPIMVKDVRLEKKKEEPKPLVLYRKAPTFKSKSGSNSSINSIASDTNTDSGFDKLMKPIVQPVSPLPASEGQYPKLKEGSQELIYLSHIIDPHNFYVQRACHQSRVQDLLREFRNAMSLPRPAPNHVAAGKVYLMRNGADNLWMRCRIVSIDRKNPHKIKYLVFCIDFGCSEVVTIDNLRLLPPARVHSPPAFAIHCCLANCQPKNGSWTSEDSFLIQNIVDNSRAVINVRRVHSMAADSVTLEVDVTTLEHGVSLAHALVFHSRAYMPERLPYRKLPQCMEKLKIFENNNYFQRNAEEEVYVTHVESPDKFYIRTLHQQKVYQDVCDELEQEFGINDKVGIIYLPEKDMVCAVDVEKYQARNCGRWERARVTETPGRGRVRVFLLDSGSTLLVHWKALRRLTKQLTVRQALATECNLAGVTPANRKWSAESVYLMKKFKDQLLKVKVEEARSHGSLGVRLFHNENDETICINDMMVHRKYAIAFGLTMFKEDLSEKHHDYSNKVPEICTTENKPETSTEAINKGPLRLEVNILNCKSPSQIYVSLVQQQAAFDELYEKIQNYYKKKTDLETKDNWKVGDRCCSLSISSKRWRRAAILEIIDTNAKVFYCDFACVETVPLTGLRELPEKFSSIGDGAIQCHLFGIMPAGQEWPSVTKEYLCELLDAYSRIFITKTGKFKGKSMPVQLWVYHTIPGGALDPDISEWRCLNNRIVEQGLAIPDKSEMIVQESSEAAGDLSFLNMTGSVRDWLQLEPIPTKSVKVEPASTTSTPTLESDTDAKSQAEIASSSSDMKFELISDWLPPEPIKKREFMGVPTYIDHKGVIFLHDRDQNDSLAFIQKALNARFQDMDPRAKFAKWSVGEPCIAQYFLDNQFYRGRVVEVNNEASSCLIHYVDYGNEEICSFENLRKSIALYQFPIQAHKFTLSRIKPKGKEWETKALDFVHKLIVDRECSVKITGDPIGGITPIDLNYNQLCINDHLVDFELAQYTDGSKPVIRVFASSVSQSEANEDLDSSAEYIAEDADALDELEESAHLMERKCTSSTDWNEIIDEYYELKEFASNCLSEFTCEVSEINNINQLELSIIFDDDKNKKYETMYSDLQVDSLNMNHINGIIENKACAAIFPDDGKWYRAILLQCSQEKGLVKVKYVDYGNKGVISIADVREITDKYLSLPPATITAKLYNVEINPDIDRQTVVDEMVALFAEKIPYRAKIFKDKNDIPSVELRNDDNTLAYDVLFKKNIFLSSK